MLSGPIPVRILRAAQFREFVPKLVEWGRQGDVTYVPRMRTQLVAARTVGEALVNLANGSEPLYETGALLPGPDATLAGPTFEEWLDSTS
jgi:hypothetical protein